MEASAANGGAAREVRIPKGHQTGASVANVGAATEVGSQKGFEAEAPVADGAPELDPLRRALQAMEEAEMTPKEKRASLRQRGVGT